MICPGDEASIYCPPTLAPVVWRGSLFNGHCPADNDTITLSDVTDSHIGISFYCGPSLRAVVDSVTNIMLSQGTVTQVTSTLHIAINSSVKGTVMCRSSLSSDLTSTLNQMIMVNVYGE